MTQLPPVVLRGDDRTRHTIQTIQGNLGDLLARGVAVHMHQLDGRPHGMLIFAFGKEEEIPAEAYVILPELLAVFMRQLVTAIAGHPFYMQPVVNSLVELIEELQGHK